MLRPNEKTTWGAGFDMLVLQGGRFRWLPDLTYVGWDVTVDEVDQVVDVCQAPIVVKHDRVHETLLLQQKQVGAPVHHARAALPIDHEYFAPEFDRDGAGIAIRSVFERRPFDARSRFYGLYLRIFREGRRLLAKMALALDAPTDAGLIQHVGGSDQPTFRMNPLLLQERVRELLAGARASSD